MGLPSIDYYSGREINLYDELIYLANASDLTCIFQDQLVSTLPDKISYLRKALNMGAVSIQECSEALKRLGGVQKP